MTSAMQTIKAPIKGAPGAGAPFVANIEDNRAVANMLPVTNARNGFTKTYGGSR